MATIVREDALRPSIADLVHQVAEDGRAAVQAEIGVWKAIAAWRLGGLKVAAPLLVTALFLTQAMLTALLVGLMLILGPVLGIGWAVLVVTLATLALIAILGWLGVRRLSTLFAPVPPETPAS